MTERHETVISAHDHCHLAAPAKGLVSPAAAAGLNAVAKQVPVPAGA
jgi:hypothetical protein